jgi:hypothetical protein
MKLAPKPGSMSKDGAICRPKRLYSRCVCRGGSSSQRLAPATFTDHENERSTSACSDVQLPWSAGYGVHTMVICG